jgi:hypothetical protein
MILRTHINGILYLKLGIIMKDNYINQITDGMYGGEVRTFRTGLHKITIFRSEVYPIFYSVKVG